jgi:small-conductance mechanosensitive channel
MTNEELQKMMEFVIQRQEVFAENMDKAEKRMSQLEKGFVGLFNIVNETAKLQKELAESQKVLQTKQDALTESQAHTDERLNALINVVERIISERNGDG